MTPTPPKKLNNRDWQNLLFKGAPKDAAELLKTSNKFRRERQRAEYRAAKADAAGTDSFDAARG